ncbi:MAG TPA: hypothetical protein VGP05_21780 [Pseudonocardia sp.]|jgi:hypothetical protein|nr:hypothetical protein [Pseudonocardia sp.]
MGWLPTAVLVVVGILFLALVLLRVLTALRLTRTASERLNTAVTGRSRRIGAGLDEVRAWRAAQHPATHPATPGPAGSIELTDDVAERTA